MKFSLSWNRNYTLSYRKRCDTMMKNIQMSLLRWSLISTSLCCHPRGKAPCYPIFIDRRSSNSQSERNCWRFLVSESFPIFLGEKCQSKPISSPKVQIAQPSCLSGVGKLFWRIYFVYVYKFYIPLQRPIVKYTSNILLLKGICDIVHFK